MFDQPLVFVRCLTYNHEAYIEDALNGFIMQQTTFPFVVTIVNDASPDNTIQVLDNFVSENCLLEKVEHSKTDYADIISAIPTKNPNCLLYILNLHENHFGKKSHRPYYQHFVDKAKYWAECEGDDYWTDPLKLQKQVDILEADETLMAVCTDTSVVDNQNNVLNAKRGGVVKNDIEGRYNLRDFFKNNHQYPTASVIYRTTHQEEVQQKQTYTRNAYLGDWNLWICLHIFGDFYYINEPMVAYRINPLSLTHTCSRVGRAKASWTICRAVADILPEEYADISAKLRKPDDAWVSLMFAYKYEKKYLHMLGCAIISMIKCPKVLLDKWKKRKR